MIEKLKCWMFGHRRGKRVAGPPDLPAVDGRVNYQCPRCKATWTRKAKA